MASIRKRGAYQWEVRIRKTGFPLRTGTFETKVAAEAWAREEESKMDRGHYIDRSPLEKTTFADLLDRYVKEITPEKKGAEQEKGVIRRMKTCKLAKMKLAHIEPADITDYRDERLKSVAPATVVKEINLISNVFNIASSEWRMKGLTNPATGIRRPKLGKGRDRRLQSPEEMQRIIDATGSEALKSLLPIAVETAMRRGEMVSIKWEDVSLTKRTIKLHDTKNGDSRVVPLSTRAIEIIRAIPAREDGQVFGIQPQTATQAFGRACKRARKQYLAECAEKGVKPIPNFLLNLRLHDMRHEATSRLFEKGLNQVEAATITGHKDLRMLMRYTHLNAEDLAHKLG